MPGVHLISLDKNDGHARSRGLSADLKIETLGDGCDGEPDAFMGSRSRRLTRSVLPKMERRAGA